MEINEFDRDSFEKWLAITNEKAALAVKHGIAPEQVPELLRLHALEDIADKLEEIQACLNDTAEAANALNKCIGWNPMGECFFLRIIGSIQSY